MARPEGSRAEKPHKAENIRLGCFLPDSHQAANAGERQGRMGPTPAELRAALAGQPPGKAHCSAQPSCRIQCSPSCRSCQLKSVPPLDELSGTSISVTGFHSPPAAPANVLCPC